MRFYLIYFILSGAILFIAYQLYTFYLGLSSTRSVYVKDFKRIKDILTQINLSPWERGELGLLSRLGDSDVERSIFGDLVKGSIYSIYHEPILAFAYKEYAADKSKLIMLRLNDDYYAYSKLNDSEIQITKNEITLGLLNHREFLELSTDKGEKINIDYSVGGDLIPVFSNDEQIISINSNATLKQSRVINVVKDFTEREEELFIVVFGYAIIEQLF
jgi:hypothetical protein